MGIVQGEMHTKHFSTNFVSYSGYVIPQDVIDSLD